MDTQKRFRKFNNKILMDYDSNSTLKEKRDILLNILREDDKLPSFSHINQGSYAMHTGIQPDYNHDVDLDVGLIFNVNKDDYTVLELKKEICEKLKNHTYYGAKIKNPCVTVTYKKDNEPAYHIDLVVYTYENKDNINSQLYLAKGKDNFYEVTKWEKSDPKGLVSLINESISNAEEREQFRRIVRYLKYWKHLRFSNTGHIEPPSIGITLLALSGFKYCYNNDLYTLYKVVEYICEQFYETYNPNYGLLKDIKLTLPKYLNFDKEIEIFSKMSPLNKNAFYEKILKLKNDLIDAIEEIDEYQQQCKINRIFNNFFDDIDEKNTSKTQRNYVPYSSSSGNRNE